MGAPFWVDLWSLAGGDGVGVGVDVGVDVGVEPGNGARGKGAAFQAVTKLTNDSEQRAMFRIPEYRFFWL
jgi:hypothetical protein